MFNFDDFLNGGPFGKDDKRSFDEEQTKEMIDRDGPYCVECGVRLSKRNIQRDHVIPHSAYGPTNSFNGQLLCKRCHKNKTRQQRGVWY